MIAGLLILSFGFSLCAAILAKVMGASFLAALATYIGSGTLSGLGLAGFAVWTAHRNGDDAFCAADGASNPAQSKPQSRYPRSRPAGL